MLLRKHFGSPSGPSLLDSELVFHDDDWLMGQSSNVAVPESGGVLACCHGTKFRLISDDAGNYSKIADVSWDTRVQSLSSLKNGIIVVSTEDFKFHLFNVPQGRIVATMEGDFVQGHPNKHCYFPQASLLATNGGGARGESLLLWKLGEADFAQTSLLKTLEPRAFGSAMRCLESVWPNRAFQAYGSGWCSFDIETGASVDSCAGGGITSCQVNALELTSSGDQVLTINSEGLMRMYDVRSCEETASGVLKNEERVLSSFCSKYRESTLVIGGANYLQLFDFRNLEDPVKSWQPDGDLFLYSLMEIDSERFAYKSTGAAVKKKANHRLQACAVWNYERDKLLHHRLPQEDVHCFGLCYVGEEDLTKGRTETE